jgi:hypothetical protein
MGKVMKVFFRSRKYRQVLGRAPDRHGGDGRCWQRAHRSFQVGLTNPFLSSRPFFTIFIWRWGSFLVSRGV